jgi:hypothetical protein
MTYQCDVAVRSSSTLLSEENRTRLQRYFAAPAHVAQAKRVEEGDEDAMVEVAAALDLPAAPVLAEIAFERRSAERAALAAMRARFFATRPPVSPVQESGRVEAPRRSPLDVRLRGLTVRGPDEERAAAKAVDAARLENGALLRSLLDAGPCDAMTRFILGERIDPSVFEVAPLADPLDGPPPGFVSLPDDFAQALLHLRRVDLERALLPEVATELPANAQTWRDPTLLAQRALLQELKVVEGLHSGRGDARARELVRWANADSADVVAFFNPTTGAVMLSGRTVPLPDAMRANIDASANAGLLRSLITDRAGGAVLDDLVAYLAPRMPTNVLEAVRRAELNRVLLLPSTALLNPTNSFASTVVAPAALFGAAVAVAGGLTVLLGGDVGAFVGAQALTMATWAKTRMAPEYDRPELRLLARWRKPRSPAEEDGVFGNFDAKRREPAVAASPWLDTASLASFFVHEIAHVLDRALGEGGPLSETPEFRALFDRTRAAAAEGRTKPAFPTPYSATEPKEFFAECLLIFLGLHANSRGGDERKVTRAVLRDQNPEVFAYFEGLLGTVLPQTLAEGRVVPSRRWAKLNVAAR